MNLALATQSNLYGLELPDDSALLSYLPLAHIYEVSGTIMYSVEFNTNFVSSVSVNFASSRSVERLATSQEIRSVFWKMRKS